MMIKMLQAASDMLVYTTEGEFRTRVDCAKIILDKVIESCIERDFVLKLLPKEAPERVVRQGVSEEEGQYKVIVGMNQELVKIDGLPLDAMVEIDGQVMTHQEAIGKNFQNGRLI